MGVTPQRVIAISLGVILWLLSFVLVPWATGSIATYLWGVGAGLLGGAAGFLVVLFGSIVGLVVGLSWSERRGVEQVRREGVRCMALVKSYRRVSMTQHRVLLVVQFPTGLAGREYMLSGLDDAWLADVCALEKPVRVIAHPTAETVIVEG